MTEVDEAARARRAADHFFAGRDALLVALLTLLGAALAVRFELSEAIFSFTRPLEHFQLDELPATVLVLTVGLVWFAWRRYRQARTELERRRAVEAQLEALLVDNRRLAQGYLHMQEEERKSLARELHDELGQYLNAIKIDALEIRQRATPDGASIERPSSAILQHVDRLYGVVRNLIGQLRPPGLDELGLGAALEHHVVVCRQRRPQVQFDFSVEGSLDDLDESTSMALYRAMQEGLTNVLRHAHANRVDVRVVRSAAVPGEVTISIADDGCGADLDGRVPGLGLLGMRERVEALGGKLQLTSAPGRGFTLRALLPARVALSHSAP